MNARYALNAANAVEEVYAMLSTAPISFQKPGQGKGSSYNPAREVVARTEVLDEMVPSQMAVIVTLWPMESAKIRTVNTSYA